MDNHVHGPKCGCADYMFNEDADDLYSSIDKDQLECLNERQIGSVSTIIRPESDKLDKQNRYVESDVDSDLIVIIPFIETVRVRSINIISRSMQTAPNLMKVYINIPNVDFDLIETQPTQEFVLAANLDGEYGNAVKISKFENVNKLIVYLNSSVNDPIQVCYIGVKGIKTEMKRQLVNTIYELNPLPSENNPLKDKKQQDAF